MTDDALIALVAEDHPGYREKVVALLSAWGLRVLVAEDGRQALNHVQYAELIDLLVTDLEMPYHNGFEVIDGWLASGRPREAVIMLTGIADHPEVQRRCASDGIRLLHKLAMDRHFPGAVQTVTAAIVAARTPAP